MRKSTDRMNTKEARSASRLRERARQKLDRRLEEGGPCGRQPATGTILKAIDVDVRQGGRFPELLISDSGTSRLVMQRSSNLSSNPLRSEWPDVEEPCRVRHLRILPEAPKKASPSV